MSTDTTRPPAERARAHTAKQPTRTLTDSLRLLGMTGGPRNAAERLVHAWIIDELEDRFPTASAAVAAAFEADEQRVTAGEDGPEVDYVAVLLANIPHGVEREG